MSKFSSSICVIASLIATESIVSPVITGIIGEEEEEEEEEEKEEEEEDMDELPMTFSAKIPLPRMLHTRPFQDFSQTLVAMLAGELELVGMVFVFSVIGEAAAELLAVELVANSTSLATCSLLLLEKARPWRTLLQHLSRQECVAAILEIVHVCLFWCPLACGAASAPRNRWLPSKSDCDPRHSCSHRMSCPQSQAALLIKL